MLVDDRRRLEVTKGRMSDGFGLSTCSAVEEEMFDLLVHLWPVELWTDELNGFGSACRDVML